MNGIFLHLLLRELRDAIADRYIDELLIRERLVQIVLDRKAVFVSLYSQAPAILLCEKLPGFEKLTVFSDAVLGSRINDVVQENLLPVVKLLLEKSDYGQTKKSEIIISLYKDAPNIRIESEDTKKQLYSRFIARAAKKSIAELKAEDITQCSGRTCSAEDRTAIFSKYEGIDRNLAQELDEKSLPALKAIMTGAAFKPKLVAILPLRISLFAGEYLKEYMTLNGLLADWITKFLDIQKQNEIQAQKAMLVKKLRKKLGKIKNDLLSEDEVEEYKKKGELILANLRKIKRGMSEVVLFDHYKQKDAVVNLAPTKSPQENAQSCFEKYKKLKRGMPKILKQIKTIEKEIENIEKTQDLTAALIKGRVAGPEPLKRQHTKPLPFREIPLPTGSTVYVGKSAKSNDALTFRFARPDDYFFHARGIEGAHAILRTKTPKGQKPNKNDIEMAAAIAAYFSKARNQKKVTVSYIQRKYLKKNKKGKAGSVILMREEVIFVYPGLPS